MAKIEYLVVHHTATPLSTTVEELRRMHVDERGWKDIGYHWVVRVNKHSIAITEEGRPQDGDDHLEPWEYGAHVRGSNSKSLGIAVVGNFSDYPMAPIIQKELLATLTKLCLHLSLSPEKAIRGHNEMPDTATECCGKLVDMDEIRHKVSGMLDVVKDVMEKYEWKH